MNKGDNEYTHPEGPTGGFIDNKAQSEWTPANPKNQRIKRPNQTQVKKNKKAGVIFKRWPKIKVT